MKSDKTYIAAADWVRIIGAFAVVCIHVTDALIVLPNHFGGMSWWFASTLNVFSRIAVPLFIMLSGYLILNKKKAFKTSEFIRKRLRFAGIPFIAWTIIYILWRLFFFVEPVNTVKLAWSIWSVSLFHLYFLTIILGLYLLTPRLRKYTDSLSFQRLSQIVAIWSLVTIVVNSLMYTYPAIRGLKNIITMPLLFGCFYLYGSCIQRVKISRIMTFYLFIIYCILGLGTALLVYFDIKNMYFAKGFGEYFQDPLSVNIMAMSYCIFPVLMKIPERFEKVVKHIAATTFGIYLIHPIIIDVVNRYLPLDIHEIKYAMWLFLSLKILLVFFVSYLLTALYIRVQQRNSV